MTATWTGEERRDSAEEHETTPSRRHWSSATPLTAADGTLTTAGAAAYAAVEFAGRQPFDWHGWDEACRRLGEIALTSNLDMLKALARLATSPLASAADLAEDMQDEQPNESGWDYARRNAHA